MAALLTTQAVKALGGQLLAEKQKIIVKHGTERTLIFNERLHA